MTKLVSIRLESIRTGKDRPSRVALASSVVAASFMPRVSIGLPVYNGENFVSDAIASVLAQSFSDWELVISDNASTDRTVEVCRRFADRDSRITVLVADKNQGAAWNFNRVFEQSSGEYFRWLSHDDYLGSDCIARCVDALDGDATVILAATKTAVINADGYQVLDDGPPESDLVFQQLTPASESNRIRLSQSTRASQRYAGILLYSRRCYEVYGLIRREAMRQTQLHPAYCGGEKVWLAEVALMGRIIELPEIQFFCRWHDARFTANNSTVEQAEHMSPGRKAHFALPHQYRSALGYLQLLLAKRIPFPERIVCFCVWLRFMLQIHKWFSILIGTISGTATAATIELPTRIGRKIVSGSNLPHDVGPDDPKTSG